MNFRHFACSEAYPLSNALSFEQHREAYRLCLLHDTDGASSKGIYSPGEYMQHCLNSGPRLFFPSSKPLTTPQVETFGGG